MSESADDNTISERRTDIHTIDNNPNNLCRVYYYTRRWTLKDGTKREQQYAMHRFIKNTLDSDGVELLDRFAKMSPEKMDLFIYKAKLLRKQRIEKEEEETLNE